MLLRGVVVNHQVQLDGDTRFVVDVAVGAFDLFEEGQELLVTVPEFQCGGDVAGGDVDGCEQGGGAVALVSRAGDARSCLLASAGSARCGPGPASGTSHRYQARSRTRACPPARRGSDELDSQPTSHRITWHPKTPGRTHWLMSTRSTSIEAPLARESTVKEVMSVPTSGDEEVRGERPVSHGLRGHDLAHPGGRAPALDHLVAAAAVAI